MTMEAMGEHLPEAIEALPLNSVGDFLFGDNEVLTLTLMPEVEAQLTPKNFMTLLNWDIDKHIDNEAVGMNAVRRFVRHTSAEFIEPRTPEAELSGTTVRTESGISSFIETGQDYPIISPRLDRNMIKQLQEIYNPNNLLALPKT